MHDISKLLQIIKNHVLFRGLEGVIMWFIIFFVYVLDPNGSDMSIISCSLIVLFYAFPLAYELLYALKEWVFEFILLCFSVFLTLFNIFSFSYRCLSCLIIELYSFVVAWAVMLTYPNPHVPWINNRNVWRSSGGSHLSLFTRGALRIFS